MDHLWEVIFLPQTAEQGESCTISEATNKQGVVAYENAAVTQNGKVTRVPKKMYCLGEAQLGNGQTVSATYYLDQKDANGDLVLNKAFLVPDGVQDNMMVITLLYTKDTIWPGANGTITSGWADRKGKFYDSNMYNAFVLQDLPGYTLVYNTQQIKVYRMNDALWNPNWPPKNATTG